MAKIQQNTTIAGGLLIISDLNATLDGITVPIFGIGTVLANGGVGINTTQVAFDSDPPNIAFTMDRGGDSKIWEFIKTHNPAFMDDPDEGVAQSQYETGDQTPAVSIPDGAKVHILYVGPALWTNNPTTNVKEQSGWLIVHGTCYLTRAGGNFTTGYKQKLQPAFTFEFLKNDKKFTLTSAQISTMLTAAEAILPDGLRQLAKLKELMGTLDLSYDANKYPAPEIAGN